MIVSDKLVPAQDLLELAEASLLKVPFIRRVERSHAGGEIIWRIHTIDGQIHALRVVSPSHHQPDDPGTILVSDRLKSHELLRSNFVDRAGNLYLFLNEHYFAHVQGKRAPTRLPAMRAPAYRVLLAWLIDPVLIGGPLRATAAAARVSTTAVTDMRTRLAEWGYVVGSKHSRVWTARGRKEARRMWLEGYRTTLRSSLDLGGFRLKGGGPQSSNLTYIRTMLAKEWSGPRIPPWRWAGTEALRHIGGIGHFIERFPTIMGGFPCISLALTPEVEDVSAILPITRSDIYNIRVYRLPVTAAANHDGLLGWPVSVPHPLMVWSELMCSSELRVNEAAAELSDILPTGWL